MYSNMKSIAFSILILSIVAISHGTLEGTIDIKRLENILQEGLKTTDIPSLYYSARGMKALNKNFQKIDLCETFKTLKYDIKNAEQIFYLANAAAMTGCVNSLKPDIMIPAGHLLDKKDATLQELYYASYTMKAIGKGDVVNKDEAVKNLVSILKKDDTPANYAYMFMLCEHIGCQDWTTTHTNSLLLAADESDGKALFFEGGLPVTSLLLTSIIRSFKALNKAVPLTEEQRYKFAQYLVWRRSVNTPKGAALLLEAALALADDEPSPISISVKGGKFVTSEVDTIEIAVTDMLGRPLRSLKPEEVIAQSGTRLSDDVVVLSKQPLIKKPNEPSIFLLNLSKIKSQYGLYKIAVSAGTKTANVNVAVLGDISVPSLEVGVGDLDGVTNPKITNVIYPNKMRDLIQVDHAQKVTISFAVRDKANNKVNVQQAFVRLATIADDHETFFVAEHDNSLNYKVELNIGSVARHVRGESGKYTLTLYVGDSAAAAPVQWEIAEIHLNLGKDPNAVGAAVKTPRKPHRGPLPELQHTFRSAEARPARLVSDVFAAACAAPLLLLIALWAKLRVNLSYFPITFSAVVFHLSLGASLALYGLFWLRLSMFETVRYLAPLALITFLSGHRLLRRLVQDKAQAQAAK